MVVLGAVPDCCSGTSLVYGLIQENLTPTVKDMIPWTRMTTWSGLGPHSAGRKTETTPQDPILTSKDIYVDLISLRAGTDAVPDNRYACATS